MGRMMGMKALTREDIRFSLELMGIRPGDTLLVHSALTSIGYVEGGADSVIDAFCDAVEDFIYYAKTIDSDVYALFFVVLLERFGLIVIDLKTIFDCIDVIVGTTCLLTTLNHAIYKFFFRYFKTYYCVQICASFA